jgi:hypothetical protein
LIVLVVPSLCSIVILERLEYVGRSAGAGRQPKVGRTPSNGAGLATHCGQGCSWAIDGVAMAVASSVAVIVSFTKADIGKAPSLQISAGDSTDPVPQVNNYLCRNGT